MNMQQVPPLSMLPNMEKQSKIGIPVLSLQIFAISFVLICVGIGGTVWAGGKEASAQTAKAEAVAAGQSLQRQKEQLDGANNFSQQGGSSQLDNAKALMRRRVDWVDYLRALERAIPSGVIIQGQLSLTNPFSNPSTPPTPQTFEFSGFARDQASIRDFLAGLKREEKWFGEPTLNSVTDAGTQAGAQVPSGFNLQFTINVPWTPPAPPAAPTAAAAPGTAPAAGATPPATPETP